MKARYVSLVVGLLVVGAGLGCVDTQGPVAQLCGGRPENCLKPIILSSTFEPVPGQDAVTFHVAAMDPSPENLLTFEWSAEKSLGLFEQTHGNRRTSAALWDNPPCMPRADDGTHGVLVTVTATNPQGFSAVQRFKFEVPLQCPEWTRESLPLIDAASHTATRLKSGSVLVAGGINDGGSLKSTALYGPASSSPVKDTSWGWAEATPMNASRAYHAAVLLEDSGQVLITGGYEVVRKNGSLERLETLSSVEVYDPNAPAGQQWRTTKDMGEPREKHTATLLPSGNVLVVGGLNNDALSQTSEEYSPKTGTWSSPSALGQPRAGHTATLLSDGKVLVVGGFEPTAGLRVRTPDGGNAANLAFNTAELYDPESKTWSTLDARLHEARYFHTATLLPSGKVLITGGFNEKGPLASSEILDPTTWKWTLAGELLTARGLHTAVLLPTGQVLVAAGQGGDGPLGSTEFFAANTLKWSPGTGLQDARTQHSATLLFSGAVLITGGVNAAGTYHVATELFPPTELGPRNQARWRPAGDMITAEAGHTATELLSGKVLVAGGYGFAPGYPGAVVYSPSTNTWLPTSTMVSNREDHTATRLASGKVLMAGGDGLGLSEIYDPVTDSWAATGNLMGAARKLHTATLLLDGRVLVAGGDMSSTGLTSAEIYDPATGLWSPTGDMTTARERHTATLLLPSGKVLVTGGIPMDGGTALDSAEIFDPTTGTWTATTSMPFAAVLHRATLLPSSGRVLIAGGTSGDIFSPPGKSAVLYDPATETWTPAADMNQGRNLPTATLLPAGKVLVTGGDLDSTDVSTAEIYDPTTGTWSPTASMAARRFNHTATLLSSGDVLVTGGFDFSPLVSSFLASAEVYLPPTESPPASP